jgi:hypothetical protein
MYGDPTLSGICARGFAEAIPNVIRITAEIAILVVNVQANGSPSFRF